MEQQRLSKLFSAYIDDRLSVEEKKELMGFIGRHQTITSLDEQIEQLWEESRLTAVLDAEAELRIQNVMRQIKPQRNQRLRILSYAVAACLAIAIGFLYFFNSANSGHSAQTPLKSHILTAQYGQRKT